MPRPRSAGTGRTRGSWTPRIAGIAAVIVVAGSGAIAYLIAAPAHASRHHEQLPTRVLSVQIVGLVGQGPAQSDGSNAPRLLSVSARGLQFGAMPPASLLQGNPQWTSDTMAGGTYVFIYAPEGKCLASAGQRRPVLALARCDLSPDQRWQRVDGTVQSDGHEYDQYRNLGSDRCLSVGGTIAGTAASPAALAPCDAAQPTSQLISFWWAT